ncbi:NAD(P)/FAD-dependent oxidoreductase [Ensifer sp. NPDC090286]|uniref:NAD(P)/FAD-dependent oxidoreductase n=1 Tax=Ensifer sp. NPDC090286 TaxID=3363991 RepID=UPI00383BDDA7
MSAIVIVGGGQAAVAAASRLRALKVERPITIIADEAVLPYQRPPLSKSYLLGGASLTDILLRPASWYAGLGIEILTGTRVDHIDRNRQRVTCDTGEERAYETLVLATGGSPRTWPATLGGNLDGVYVARNKADADRLMPEMITGKTMLVVGGGYVGLEAAAVGAELGLNVTVIEAEARILNRVASSATSDFLKELHVRHGVSIKERTGLVRFVGNNGRVAEAEMSDGSILPINFAIVGIGITPNIGLAEGCGLAVMNGILVDAFGRTSDPNVYAVGDCAAFPYGQGTVRLECVQNAIDLAEAASASIAGSPKPYAPVPWFWSDQYDAKLQIAGLNTGYTDVLSRVGKTADARSLWYFDKERFLAVDAINDGKSFVMGKKLLARGISPSRDILADPDVDVVGYVQSLLR